MLFNTPAFGIFLAFVVIGTWLLARHGRARMWLLLAASYFF